MIINKRRCYAPKTYQNELFTWCPDRSIRKTNQNGGMGVFVNKQIGCSSAPNTQGNDWNTTYSYVIAVTSSGVQQRMPYAACDYVQ